MIDVLAPLALVGLAAFVGVFVWTARRQRRERDRMFQELASGRGWRYLKTDDGTAQALSEGFQEFARFRSSSLGERPPTSVVVGEVEEGRVCVFSHATREYEGDARQWTVCLIEAPSAVGPAMRVRPRSERLPFPIEVQTRDRRLAVYPAGRDDAPETVAQLEALVEHARELARALKHPGD